MPLLRIKTKNELLPLALLVIALIVVIAVFPSNILRIVLGLPFVLFFPGYTLMAAFFPRRKALGSIERVALSFGMSIAIIPLIGLILNAAPWGIRLEPILYTVACFILTMSLIAWVRRKRLVEEERFGVEFTIAFPSWGTSVQDRALSIIVAFAVLGALGVVGHIIATPKAGQGFTEFYILDLKGKSIDYPTALKLGEEGRVIIVIINHEYETVSYQVEVQIGGTKDNGVGPIILENNGEWRQEIGFIPQIAGKKQKTVFLLYKDGTAEPYLEPLVLWVDVTK